MVVQTWIPSTQGIEQEDQNFKVILNFVASFRPTGLYKTQPPKNLK